MFVRIVRGLSRRRRESLFGLITFMMLLQFGCVPAAYESPGDMPGESDDVQYLAQYGEWLNVPPFGMVWRPDVVSDWEPFYFGHWTWTYDGWAWVSYEPFGWLVYHYGYWNHRPGIGWFWVSGDAWSPARVEWYSFGDYCAWAPLPPPSVYWPDPWEPFETNVWIVVNVDGFTDENIGRHRILTPPRREIIGRESVVKRPPDIKRVELLEKRTVPIVKLRKRQVDVRPQALPSPAESVGAKAPKLERMVLPQADTRKVKKHAPAVEREVLAPRKRTAPESQPPEKDTEQAPKRTPIRR